MIMIDTDLDVYCPHCGSADVVFGVWNEYGDLVWECDDCGAQWPEESSCQ